MPSNNSTILTTETRLVCSISLLHSLENMTLSPGCVRPASGSWLPSVVIENPNQKFWACSQAGRNACEYLHGLPLYIWGRPICKQIRCRNAMSLILTSTIFSFLFLTVFFDFLSFLRPCSLVVYFLCISMHSLQQVAAKKTKEIKYI